MHTRRFYLWFTILCLISTPLSAEEQATCAADDISCLMGLIAGDIDSIKEPRWRDNARRDLATSMAFANDIDGAINMIRAIDNPDTQAMTIRAIGMALAIHRDLSDAEYRAVFAKLDDMAATISHEGARDIAYTYIAMAQAFAELDADATKTTEAMTKPELKNKAFGETAEIQAERGDVEAALKSLNLIESIAFKNKAMAKVSDILLKKGDFDNATTVALAITNPTTRTTALQNIIDTQIGLETSTRK